MRCLMMLPKELFVLISVALHSHEALAVQHGPYVRNVSALNETANALTSSSSRTSTSPSSSSTPNTQRSSSLSSGTASSALTSGLGSFILQGLDPSAAATDISSFTSASHGSTPIANSSSTSADTQQLTVTQVITLIPISNATKSPGLSATGSINSANSANATATSAKNETLQNADSCNDASISWSSKYRTYSTYSTFGLTTTYIYNTATYKNVSTYTLCDGYPRANIPDPVQTTISSFVGPVYAYSYFIQPNATEPRPSCSIGSSACSSLWSSFITSGASATTHYGTEPACPTPSSLGTTFCAEDIFFTNTYEPPCTFNAGQIRLVYFPPEISPANETARLCGNYTTVTRNATGPVIATAFGTTFTSGTAYISFESLAASNRCGSKTGSALENFFLPVRSGDVSSLCAEYQAPQFGGLPTSLNFADLASPVPLSAYSCQAKCDFGFANFNAWEDLCPTVYNDYAPVLAYPTAITTLQPEWQSCWFDSQIKNQNLLWDPPIALQPASVAASATLPKAEPTTAAQTAHQTTAQTLPTTPANTPAKTDTTSVKQVDTSSVEALPDNTSTLQKADPSKQSSDLFSFDPPNPLTSQQPTTTNALIILSQALSPTSTPVVATIGGVTVTQENNGGIIAGSSTLTVGATAQISGIAVSVGSSDIVVDGSSTILLGTNISPISPPAIATVGGVTLSPAARTGIEGEGVVIGSTTLTAGQTTVISGTPISVGPSQVVVGTSTISLGGSSAAYSAALTLAKSGSAIIVDGSTLAPGRTEVINGQTISALSDGNGVVVAGSTVTLANGAVSTVAPGLDVSRSKSHYIVDGSTLTPGQVATVNGEMISELSNGNGVVIGSSTISLDDGSLTVLTATTTAAVLDISYSGSAYIVDGTILTPGEVATIADQRISELANGDGLVIGSSTLSLSDHGETTITPASNSASLFSETVVTIGSSTITAYGISGHTGEVVMDGTTLIVGGSPATIDGETFSLGPSGLVQIDGGKTRTLTGVGNKPGPSTGTGNTQGPTQTMRPHEGGAGRIESKYWPFGLGGLLGVGFALL